ncbi:hypothetical protein Bca4012_031655 [Brassica carinata]
MKKKNRKKKSPKDNRLPLRRRERESLLWAIESMQSHHVTKVIFEVDFADLVGAVTKPKAWPAFRYQANRCAQAIAKSVTREKRFQSYVAMGNPQWLKELFEADLQRMG